MRGHRRSGAGWRVAAVLAVTTFGTGFGPGESPRGQGDRDDRRERLIVVLDDSTRDAEAVAREHERRYGGEVVAVFEHAVKGYTVNLPEHARAAMARDRRVAYVERDQLVHALAELPTGVDRVEGEANATANIDGVDERVDADIAILDTGISPHADLNIVGGARCTSLLGLFPRCTTSGSTLDGHGHGTHVAGIAAAKDNGSGVVGVAPGARLWAIKVLSDSGSGYISQIVAGIDFVTSRASTIEIANMSLGAPVTSRVLTDALTRSTNSGVVYVVAAGNSAADAGSFAPASHDQVITVSAMADFDGQPGGGAPPTCRRDVDDTFADFSNYGDVVDLAAPGVCIRSTWLNGGYNTISGTSMAAPHAAGAAALYVVANAVPPSATRWSTVRNGLRAEWSVPQTSPCGFADGRSAEPMLLVAPCGSES